MDYLDWIQSPAMVVSIPEAWMVGSKTECRGTFGCWVFLSSNLLWITWGLYTAASALIILQLGLVAINVRGGIKNSH